MNDVLWGQFCVYLAFRIKDDLLDRVSDSGRLVLAADLIQCESVRTFLRHFPHRSRFWREYFASIEATIRGETRVDRLQRARKGSATVLLNEYARVCAIFTIGASAVCIRYSGSRDLRRARLFWREIAVAGQLLDDFQDLDEDWRRGRFNSVARVMLGKSLSGPARSGRALIAVKQTLAAGGIDRLFRMVLQRIDRAEETLKPIGNGAPYPGLSQFRDDIGRMRRTMHREGVRLFFSRVQGTPRRSPD